MSIYEVGYGECRACIEAPSAEAAALYYGIYVDKAREPFAVHVYMEDGQQFVGDEWWYNEDASYAFINETVARALPDLYRCRRVNG